MQDELDWDTFAIVVHSSSIASIGDLIDAADAAKMRKALRTVKHRFTLESTVDYVTDFVSQVIRIAGCVLLSLRVQRCHPAPAEYV